MDTPRTGLMLYQTKTCQYCGRFTILELDSKALESWRLGQYIQDAFPELDDPTRELLITGTHPECWTEMFSYLDEE